MNWELCMWHGIAASCFLLIFILFFSKQTTGHKWHVHKMPVGDDATSGCLSPSGHYNPFQVDVDVSFYITSNIYK